MLAVPEAIGCAGVDWKDCSLLLVPYSNQAVTAHPLGLTLPFRFAPSLPMVVAADVATVGDEGTT